MYQVEGHYTITELSIITGLTFAHLHNNIDIPYTLDHNHPNTNKPVKIISTYDFENFLESKKTWDFDSTEYNKYLTVKRPICRHFLHSTEVVEFFKLVDDYPISLSNVHSSLIRNKKIPAYQVDRKYLIPIHSVVEFSNASDEDQLSKVILSIIEKKN